MRSCFRTCLLRRLLSQGQDSVLPALADIQGLNINIGFGVLRVHPEFVRDLDLVPSFLFFAGSKENFFLFGSQIVCPSSSSVPLTTVSSKSGRGAIGSAGI